MSIRYLVAAWFVVISVFTVGLSVAAEADRDDAEVPRYAIDFRIVEVDKESKSEKVLSSPTLVTLEGKPATLTVGGEVPVPAAEGATELLITGLSIRTVVYRNNEQLFLDIDFEHSRPIEMADDNVQVKIERRGLRSVVAIETGRWLTVGGVDREKGKNQCISVRVERSEDE